MSGRDGGAPVRRLRLDWQAGGLRLHVSALQAAGARVSGALRIWYRVRFADSEGSPRFLGYGPSGPLTRGYPTANMVLEPDAWCFDSPRSAAEAAVNAACLPFTVEEVRS